MPGPKERADIAAKIHALPARIISAHSFAGQPWKISVDARLNPTADKAKQVRAQTERLKKQCVDRLKRAGIKAGAPDPNAAVDFYLRLRWKEWQQRLGILPELTGLVSAHEQFQYQKEHRVFRVSGIALPATTWAHPIDDKGLHFGISVDNPPNISAPEIKRIRRTCQTVVKQFAKAVNAPNGLDHLWNDHNQRWKQDDRSEEERGHFRLLLGEEDGRLIEYRVIEDVRWVLLRYSEAHFWGGVPTNRKNKGPGRPKGSELDGAKIREVRSTLGLSQSALGDSCTPTLSVHTIGRIEREASVDEKTGANLVKTIVRLGLKSGISIKVDDLSKKKPVTHRKASTYK